MYNTHNSVKSGDRYIITIKFHSSSSPVNCKIRHRAKAVTSPLLRRMCLYLYQLGLESLCMYACFTFVRFVFENSLAKTTLLSPGTYSWPLLLCMRESYC